MVEATKHVPVDTGFWPHFLDPLKTMGNRIAEYFSPAADAAATTDAYEIELELPGVDEKDIEVTVNDHLLTVKGEKHFERKEDTKEYFFAERRYGAFQRSFRLPDNAAEDGIKADFDKGILKLVVPKMAKSDARRIEVKGRG